MPELPEVEVVRQGLARCLPGKTITSLRTDQKPLRWPVPESLLRDHLPGATITSVKRRAKYLLIELHNGCLLIIHLGMTGKLGLFQAESPDLKHDHVFLQLEDGSELRFNDVRRFGSIALLTPGEVGEMEETFFSTAGPEPFDPAFTGDYLRDLAHGRSQPVKNFIMDSRVVAGVGNIYANESLFSSGIRPTRAIGRISRIRWNRLAENIRMVLDEAITCGGSTISDFFGTNGESGYFQINFKVYGKDGQPCVQCATDIRKIQLGGRASFYCPACQR
jgi:formamidopyrimidine-DNA glycosylase